MTLVDIEAAAVGVGRPYSTVRRWVSSGLVPRRGRDGRRVLVDYADVCRVAEAQGRRVRLDDAPPGM